MTEVLPAVTSTCHKFLTFRSQIEVLKGWLLPITNQNCIHRRILKTTASIWPDNFTDRNRRNFYSTSCFLRALGKLPLSSEVTVHTINAGYNDAHLLTQSLHPYCDSDGSQLRRILQEATYSSEEGWETICVADPLPSIQTKAKRLIASSKL